MFEVCSYNLFVMGLYRVSAEVALELRYRLK